MEISKVDNLIYQIKKQGTDKSWDSVLIDPIINPLHKYIFHIELEQKPGTNTNHFFFGLVKDEGKYNCLSHSQYLSYYDYSNGYGVTKYIKGNQMNSGYKALGKHSFEVRIYLNQQLLRVASLPGYSSIAELEDVNKIDPKVPYRFFLSMYDLGDIMRITSVKTVSEFDEKM